MRCVPRHYERDPHADTRRAGSPGSTVGACTVSEACKNVAASINRAHKETSSVVCVIENMVGLAGCRRGCQCLMVAGQAGAGNILGSTFEQIAEIIEHVENKERVGVCIDTCGCRIGSIRTLRPS